MKGQIAKDNVINKIAAAFGKDYVGLVDKKVYVWSEEDREKVQVCLSLTCVQVCLSLTCPKNPVGVGGEENGMNFGASTISTTPDVFNPAEISDKEMENVRNLIKELGL